MKADYRVKDIYKNEDIEIPYKDFSAFVTECNFELLKAMILENLIIKLPSMGSLSIKKYKPKVLNDKGELNKKALKVDYGATRKLWKEKYPGMTIEQIKEIPDRPLVYYTNKHSGGFIYKFYWDKFTSSLPGKSVYQFRPARDHSRFLARLVKDPNVEIDFFEKT